MAASVTVRRWTPEGSAAPSCGAALQAAVDGFKISRPAPQPSELACEQCSAVLFQPITLGDGRTVCKPCVRKVQKRLDGEVEAGFGGSTNTVLDALSQACLPGGHAAAAERQEGNRLFAAKDHEAASAAMPRRLPSHPQTSCRSATSPPRGLPSAMRLVQSRRQDAPCNSAAARTHAPDAPKGVVSAGERMLAGGTADADTAVKALLAAALAAGASYLTTRSDEKSAERKLLQRAVDALSAARRRHSPPASSAARERRCARRAPGRGVGRRGDTDAPRRRLAEAAVREQLDCPLCVELLHEPCALPCGHVMPRASRARPSVGPAAALPDVPHRARTLSPVDQPRRWRRER